MQPKILVVDDEPGLCDILSDLLDIEGYAVTVCSDEPSAVRALSSETFAVAMLDVFLHGVPKGLDIARRILSEYPSTSVIMMTGFADRGDIDFACLNGAYTCIDKPFNIDDVVRVVGMAAGNGHSEKYAIGSG